MSKHKTTTPTLRVLRALLLVALVGFVALVIALYRFGKTGMPGANAPEESAAEQPAERPAVMSGEGFDYTISQDERPIARIRADRIVSEREDEVALAGLDPVEIFREGGAVYRVFSDEGTYNLDTQETTLSGNVRLEGPRGLELFADGMSMTRGARRVHSDSPVRFRMAGEFLGRAKALQANLERDLFVLNGEVQIESVSAEREPVRLSADRIAYYRQDGMIRAVGDVRFDRSGSFFRAAEMQFFLTDDERHLRYVAAQQGIIGRFVKRYGANLYRFVELQGDELEAVLDPVTGDPVEGELRAPDSVARLAAVDESSMVRQMVAPVLHARFENGDIRYAEAFELVHLREYPAFDETFVFTWGCGQRAEVWFDDDGEIAQAKFYERVEFRQPRGLAKGDRLDLSADSAEMTMTGTPARFVGRDAELTAPTIVRQTESGEVRAVGGVRGWFEEAGSNLSLGGAEGAIRLESGEALWNPEAESFKFYDNVRLWQEENLLLADEVESFKERDLIVARGGIKTILEPEKGEEEEAAAAQDAAKAREENAEEGAAEATRSSSEEAEAEASAGSAPATTEAEGAGGEEAATGEAAEADGEEPAGLGDEPIQITSDWMEYETKTGIARYHDQVVMLQAGRRMSCDTAEAKLAEGGGIETLRCTGKARVVDGVAHRTVTGDSAFYQVSRGEVEFEGKPVRMTGDKGERVEGATMVYDLRTGGARVTSSGGEPDNAETAPESATESGSEATENEPAEPAPASNPPENPPNRSR